MIYLTYNKTRHNRRPRILLRKHSMHEWHNKSVQIWNYQNDNNVPEHGYSLGLIFRIQLIQTVVIRWVVAAVYPCVQSQLVGQIHQRYLAENGTNQHKQKWNGRIRVWKACNLADCNFADSESSLCIFAGLIITCGESEFTPIWSLVPDPPDITYNFQYMHACMNLYSNACCMHAVQHL